MIYMMTSAKQIK